MGTELPTERLHRRLGAELDADSARRATTAIPMPHCRVGCPAQYRRTARVARGRPRGPRPRRCHRIGSRRGGGRVGHRLHAASGQDSAGGIGETAAGGDGFNRSATPSAPAPEGPVIVSVVGLVHKPGLVTLSSGARLADALEGCRWRARRCRLIGLNMARRLADGEQIIVGIAAPPGEPTTMGSSIGAEPSARISGGPKATGSDSSQTVGRPECRNAGATGHPAGCRPGDRGGIIAWRDANGSFTSVDQLADIDGMGPARLEKLRAQVYVCGADGREARLDVRLVPAALTSWGVTAAGILWSTSGRIVVLSGRSPPRCAACWGSGPRLTARGGADDSGGRVAIALVGLGFAVAVPLRVDRCGTIRSSTATVTPPRSSWPRAKHHGRSVTAG